MREAAAFGQSLSRTEVHGPIPYTYHSSIFQQPRIHSIYSLLQYDGALMKLK